MNCQEFRENWMNGSDDAALSHIENCDDCLLWIEANSLSEEEVMYLKEFPQPSPQLEDKIMQAVYAMAGQGVLPPHSAAEQLVNEQKISLPKTRRFFFSSTAWVSAAAVLLAVGLLSYQGISRQDESNLASTQDVAPVQKESQIASIADANTTNSSNTANRTTPAQPTVPNTNTAHTTPPAALASSNQPAVNPSGGSAMDTAIAMSPKTSSASITEMSSRKGPLLPATGTPNESLMGSAALKEPGAPASTEEKVAMSSLAEDTAREKAGATLTAPSLAAQQPAEASILAAPEEPAYSLAATAGTEGPKDVTISTFIEIQTAVQASDMPIPVFEHLPDGLALSSVMLQYESQTSKHVIGVSVVYANSKEQVTVEVKPVADDKQVSIPGVFANRELFTVNESQAIGVTYQLPPTSPANEHAVHFMNNSNNQHLYVILSSHSGTLDRLIEMAKSTSWKK